MNIVNESQQPVAACLMREISNVTKVFIEELKEGGEHDAFEIAEEVMKGHAGALAYDLMRLIPTDLWIEVLASAVTFIKTNFEANKSFHELMEKRRKEKEEK